MNEKPAASATPHALMDLTEELVKHCHREVADGLEDRRYDYLKDEDYPPLVAAMLSKRPPGPFWIFAYGSLIWKREFATPEQRFGTAAGWHRSFCLRLYSYRGSIEQPGLMLALDKGGKCDGLLLRVADEDADKILYDLLYREVGSYEQLESARWIDVETRDGTVQALTFYAGPHNLQYYTSALPLTEVAHVLARACGSWGSGAEYLHNTVKYLEMAGIRDENLWELQRLTAAEIRALRSREI